MRNTSDLVKEMQEEAKNAWLVAIAVGFPDDTKFVFSSGKDPLRALNQLIKDGGFPIGLLRFDKEGGSIQGAYRPFSEYESEEWVRTYLDGLLKKTADIIAMGQYQASLPDY